ncbi:MAG: chromate transporter [Bacteroidales bacterium]|nr:chromate transporter [Bacteroidales bacterium]
MTVSLLILQLMWTFFVIGAFTIGGGYAMLSLIQNEVVVAHGWISESTFTDIVAVSQMTPGPIGINTATYVGYDVLFQATGSQALGVCGSFAATLALILPSLVIMLLIVKFYTRFRSSTLYAGTMDFLKPCVVGLIGAAALVLMVKTTWTAGALADGAALADGVESDAAVAGMAQGGLSAWFGRIPSISLVRENFPDWRSWVLLAAAFIASWWRKINPILIILAAAALGLLLY